MVEKDETGKLWDYIFAPKEFSNKQNSHGTSSLLIHKSDLSESNPERIQTGLAEQECVAVGMLPLHELPLAQARIRKE